MFKEIEEPDFYRKKVYNVVKRNERFFFNEKTNEYYNLDDDAKYYFNENGWHRLDGSSANFQNTFWIDGKFYYDKDFAIKTNHLICKICNNFCKQGCFLNDKRNSKT